MATFTGFQMSSESVDDVVDDIIVVVCVIVVFDVFWLISQLFETIVV